MSGTLHGSIDHNITTSAANGCRDVFAACVNYFDSRFTRIASQKGSGYNGTGAITGYTSDTNRSGDNAFGVWRWDRADGKKLYILLQWQYNSSMGASPGNPGSPSQVNYGVVIQFAMRLDGGNPWNGTSANDGADTKNGTNVWVDGGSTLVVWPRVNGPSGSSTTKSGLMMLSSYGTTTRFNIMSDDTSIYWFTNHDAGPIDVIGFFAPYTPRSSITPDLGYCCLAQNTSLPDFNGLVGNTGGGGTHEGGAVIAAADGVRSFKYMAIERLNSAIFEPNTLVSGSPFDLLDVYLRMEDSTSPAKYGLFGKLNVDDLAISYNYPNNDTNVGKTKIAIGSDVTLNYRWVFPWDGVTTPGSTSAQTGVQF
jgi:hypothetical protein